MCQSSERELLSNVDLTQQTENYSEGIQSIVLLYLYRVNILLYTKGQYLDMDAYGNSFAKHSLKIGTASFNCRDFTKMTPRNSYSDEVIKVYQGMYSGGGRRRNSCNGLQKFEPVRRRKSSPSSPKLELSVNITVGDLLKRNKTKALDNALDLEPIDLDTKIGVDLDHYDQWARTRRPEVKVRAISPEPFEMQTKARCVKTEKNAQIQVPKSDRQRPHSVYGTLVSEDQDAKENIHESTNENSKSDINEQNDDIDEGMKVSRNVSQNISNESHYYDSKKSYKLTQWNNWSGRTPKLPRTVLRELQRSCGKIIKDVQRASYETYCQLVSDDYENESYTPHLEGQDSSSTGKRERLTSCRSNRTPFINPETEWIENLNYTSTSLSVQKLPGLHNYDQSHNQNYGDWKLNIDRDKMGTFALEFPPKRCLSSRESARREDLSYRNTMQYKMHLPIAKKEPLLFNNKNQVVDFRSKRLENLCKLCEKNGKNPVEGKTVISNKFMDRRPFLGTAGYSQTFNSFLRRQMKEKRSSEEPTNLTDNLSHRNHATYRFCIAGRDEKTSDFVKLVGI